MEHLTFEQWAGQLQFPVEEQQMLALEIVHCCREVIGAESTQIATKVRALMTSVSGMHDGSSVRERSASLLGALSVNILLHCSLTDMPEAENALYDASELANSLLPDEEARDVDDEGGPAPLKDDERWLIPAMHQAARNPCQN